MPNQWTNHEIKRLDELYGTKLVRDILPEFPGRTSRAIEIMASKRGLQKKYRKISRPVRVNKYLAFAENYKPSIVFAR